MKKIVLGITIFVVMHANVNAKKECGCQHIPHRMLGLYQPSSSLKLKSQKVNHQNMVKVPAGMLLMGGDSILARRDEFPKHKVMLHSFWMDKTLVTNAAFRQFVIANQYVTTAEQKPDWELLKQQLPPNTPKPDESKLVAASLIFTPPDHKVGLDDYSQWWTWMSGADWKHPHGPESSIAGLDNHPVVHVSWFDAKAYCEAQGKRLPTEAEWEWAARGGLKNQLYPWGNEPLNQGKVKANTWEGEFPYLNTKHANYQYTSPVKLFSANNYGLFDMAGNVWEWVADWYRSDYYASHKLIKNPQGPDTSFDPSEPYAAKKVLRGGSFLCNETYCSGYRVAARMKSTPDTSMEHIGFRCATSF